MQIKKVTETAQDRYIVTRDQEQEIIYGI